MCLLAVISEEPSYGYEMVRKLSDRGFDLVSEGAIYPVLSRLQRNGLVETHLVESSGGPARKYYKATGAGRSALTTWENEWMSLATGVAGVLRRGET